ncbi:MAG: hypothetical protein AB1711_11250 [Thermodesulfobacteriota bacterium]
MRTNGDFIRDLRAEIADGQERRTAYTKLKLTFVVGMLGIGSAAIDNLIETTPLLYLVPLIAFVFDLYILGEDFGIKRAGIFIKTSPAAPSEEKLWETKVEKKRDLFAFFATPLSSLLILIAATMGIKTSKTNLLPIIPWFLFNCVFVLLISLNGVIRKRRLEKFESLLSDKIVERLQNVEYGGSTDQDR